MAIKVPENIANLIPYVPGKPIEELERELGITESIKVASNENPFGPSPKALEYIKKNLDKIHRYPDGSAYYLKRKIAEKFNLSMEEIIVGNGSNELIELIIRTFAFPNSVTLTSQYTFIIYKLASLAHGIKCIEIPMENYKYNLKKMADYIDNSVRFVFIANPNNPTGTYVTRKELEDFIRILPDETILVLDEAYIEYVDAEDFPDGLYIRKLHKNTVVLRTFSKIYGLAGLRVGYGFAPSEIVEYINRVRAPFNVSSLAQWGAIGALDDEEFIRKVRENCIKERVWLVEAMSELGLYVVPSQANFVLVDLGNRDGVMIYNQLLRKGVIVRPMASYGFPSHHRVTVGTHEENVKVVSAYREVLGTVD